MNPFTISSPAEFTRLALETFRHQAAGNPVYGQYLGLLGCDPGSITDPDKIPFLPVEFFKTRRIVTGADRESMVFESSGTTGSRTSRHYILDEGIYLRSLEEGFRLLVGNPADFCILALLPSYLERQNSSLVFMMDRLIRLSGQPESGFYLDNLDRLVGTLQTLEQSGRKTLLVGVSFALLDLAEKHPMKLRHTILAETGGMKGRREEITREELHEILTNAFGVETVWSEYGMTELLSQAWSAGKGLYRTPPWMQVIIRDPYDPFKRLEDGKTGGIDIIDLANRCSCSFIQTQDLGRRHPDGTFEVVGRFDNSELRGCNMLF
jgi:phenylacetate-coenzyme A ligase PaaK-like adenylate-forming protein